MYYLHVKAVDFAGNETIETKRIMLNTLAKITSAVRPTSPQTSRTTSTINRRLAARGTERSGSSIAGAERRARAGLLTAAPAEPADAGALAPRTLVLGRRAIAAVVLLA